MITALKPLRPASLKWRDGTPYSDIFDDVYFSASDGLAESRYVFLQGNDLPARFASADHFTIGETGFGTGLNFLLSLAAWRESAPPAAHLHYLSVEKHPLSIADLRRVSRLWPALAAPAEELLSLYPPLLGGRHQLQLRDGRVTLTLLLGDALALLPDVQTVVDAWYLDGFAPAKNPAMWSAGVLREVARLSRPGTSFATFTAAGAVRRELQAAGFTVHKRAGFGRKREMLAGQMKHTPSR